MKEFQLSYLRNGKGNFTAQTEFLVELAEDYERQFDELRGENGDSSNCWVDAFKVNATNYIVKQTIEYAKFIRLKIV